MYAHTQFLARSHTWTTRSQVPNQAQEWAEQEYSNNISSNIIPTASDGMLFLWYVYNRRMKPPENFNTFYKSLWVCIEIASDSKDTKKYFHKKCWFECFFGVVDFHLDIQCLKSERSPIQTKVIARTYIQRRPHIAYTSIRLLLLEMQYDCVLWLCRSSFHVSNLSQSFPYSVSLHSYIRLFFLNILFGAASSSLSSSSSSPSCFQCSHGVCVPLMSLSLFLSHSISSLSFSIALFPCIGMKHCVPSCLVVQFCLVLFSYILPCIELLELLAHTLTFLDIVVYLTHFTHNTQNDMYVWYGMFIRVVLFLA